MDPLSTADIERRRTRLLASVFVLLAAFATLSVSLSWLDPEILRPLRLTPAAARVGVLLLTLAFGVLVMERDRVLRRMAADNERARVLATTLKSRLDVLESLLIAGDRLNAPLSVQDVLDVLVDSAIELVGADGGMVTTVDEEEAEITVARRHSLAVDPSVVQLSEGIEVPLVVGEQRIGSLYLSLPFDRHDPVVADVLDRFATRAAIALRRAQLTARDRASVAYFRAANLVKARFLQTVSHELRTPLTSIIGYSKTLEVHWARLPEETKLEFMRSINEQGMKLKMLVERILEAARVESEGVTVRRVVHDVRRSVERAVAGFTHDRDRVEIAIPDSPVYAEIDPFVVEQAVQNLVDNGLRYTCGSVRVSLDAYRSSVVVAVTDEGPGMSPEHLSLVVQPLYRVDENVNSGTGLGLHIVRTLVTDHGGRLEIASDENGTRAQVILPRGAEVAVTEVQAHSA